MEKSASQTLQNAETYLKLQMDLSECLRQGYVALAGARSSLRSNSLLLNQETWPSQNTAALVIMDSTVHLRPLLGDRLVEEWIQHTKPTKDLEEAKIQFVRAVDIVVKLVSVEKLLSS